MRRLLQTMVLIGVVLLVAVSLVIYAQGKRLDGNGKLTDTGIIQIDTTPNSAKVFTNGTEKGQSDISIEDLKPGDYSIRIEKEHYSSWEKVITVKKGLVNPLKVTLFPSNPSLTALTFDGIYTPKLSPNRKKVAFGIQDPSKAGLWVMDLVDSQFFFNNKPRQIAFDSAEYIFSKSVFTWSADNSALLAEVQPLGSTETKAFLLKQNDSNTSPTLVTNSDQLKKTWQDTLSKNSFDLAAKYGDKVKELSKDSKSISFSKEGDGVLIVKTDNSAVVYDQKPSPVPGTKPGLYDLPVADNYFWFQGDDKRLVVIEKNTLSLMDTDGSNKVGIFTGDFDPNGVFCWPDGSKLVVSINLNSKANPLPNLYTIDLR